jgi:hypothetical protein
MRPINMGSLQSVELGWQEIEKIHNAKCETLSLTNLQLINTETDSEYFLRCKIRMNSFIVEKDDTPLLMHVLMCESFEQTKYTYERLNILKNLSSPLVEPILDTFDFMEQSRKNFNLAVITPVCAFATIGEWLSVYEDEALKGSNESICTSTALDGFLFLLEEVAKIHDRGDFLGFLTMQNLALVVHDEGSPTDISALGPKFLSLSLKYLAHNNCDSQRPPEGDFRTQTSDVWCIGCILFTVLTQISPRVSLLGHKEYVQREAYVKTHVKDLAILQIILICLQDAPYRMPAQELRSHPYIQAWHLLKTEKYEDLCIQSIAALGSQLVLKCHSKYKSSTLGFFRLASANASSVADYIDSQGLDWRAIIEIAGAQGSWTPLMLEGAARLFLQLLPRKQKFRRHMIDCGFVDAMLANALTLPPDVAFPFFSEFCRGLSSTFPLLLRYHGLTQKAISLLEESATAKQYVELMVPKSGGKALGSILGMVKSSLLTVSEVLCYLSRVSGVYATDYDRLFSVFAWLVNQVYKAKHINLDDTYDCTIAILKTMSYLLHSSSSFSQLSLHNECFSTCKSSIDVGPQPFTAQCQTCNVPICSTCVASCHSGCKVKCTPHGTTTCLCSSEHSKQPYSAIKLNQLTSRSTSFACPEGCLVSGTASGFRLEVRGVTKLVMESTEFSLPSPDERQFYYYEVEVSCAGARDFCSIGLPGIEYQSWSGHILHNGAVIAQGPRYGSHDTVGAGTNTLGSVFFTYNGVLIRPMLQVVAVPRAVLCLTGPKCDLKVHFSPLARLFASEKKAAVSLPSPLLKVIEKLLKYLASHSTNEVMSSSLKEITSLHFAGDLGRIKRQIPGRELSRHEVLCNCGNCHQSCCALM